MTIKPAQFSRRLARGFSLIELLVTIVISLLAALAIFGVLSTYEGKKRSTTFVNDAVQGGNFGMFYTERLLRSAGSGFSSNFTYDYGCTLKGYNSAGTTSTTIFPTSSLSPEFTQVQTDTGGNFVLAPVLIDYQGSQDGVSDAIIVMEGASGNAEAPVPFTAQPSVSTAVPLQNTVPYLPSDLLLLTDAPGANATSPLSPCLLSQVNSNYAQSSAGSTSAVPLPLGGTGSTFYVSSVSGTGITGYSKSAQMVDLGNPTTDSGPAFEILGVNSNHVLVDYALLQASGTANQVADGVFEIHALYGIDGSTTGAGTVTAWVSPSGSAASGSTGYDIKSLMTGYAGAKIGGGGAYTLERIKAIRVGFILRTDLPENTKTPTVPITPGPIVLFSDLGTNLQYTRVLTTAEQGYRYRTIEATIPLRNNLLLAQ